MLDARTAVNTARTVWDSPKGVALPTKTPPKLVNRQSFILESQKKTSHKTITGPSENKACNNKEKEKYNFKCK